MASIYRGGNQGTERLCTQSHKYTLPKITVETNWDFSCITLIRYKEPKKGWCFFFFFSHFKLICTNLLAADNILIYYLPKGLINPINID